MNSSQHTKGRGASNLPPMIWAVVADLEGSRHILNREGFAKRLEEVLTELGQGAEAGKNEWIAPLESTRGLDELSGAVLKPGPALRAYFHLNRSLWPHRFRFALGRGRIDVGLESGQAGSMDGPAFHLAADALDRAKKEGKPLAIAARGAPDSALALAESCAGLHASCVLAWTPRQAAVVSAWLRTRNQKSVAASLGVTQSTISEILAKARLKTIMKAERDLSAFLDWIDENLPGE